MNSAMARTLITVPSSAQAGELIEIRCLIAHAMETGYRRSDEGQVMTRELIRRFRCEYAGRTVFTAELFAAISANPLIAFWLRAEASGPLRFVWEGDNGFSQVEDVMLVVR